MKAKTVGCAMLTGAVLVLIGCASPKLGDQTTAAELKKFAPVSGKTSLYVCREDSWMASAVSTNISLDNKLIGTTRRNTFVHAVVEPGTHTVRMSNGGVTGMGNPSITLQTRPNEVVFLWVGVSGRGWGAYTIDHFDNRQQGMDCVANATYVVKVD